MPKNTDIITEFVSSWKSLDASLLASYFTEDGTYHNMPAQPVIGRDNIRRFISGFIANWTETQWDILNLSGHGDIVFCERLDRTKTERGVSAVVGDRSTG